MPKTQPAPAATSALAFGREHASDPAAAGAPVRRRALVRPERLRLSKAEATSAPTSACSPASRATPASARRRGFDRPEPRREQSLVAQADSSAQLGGCRTNQTGCTNLTTANFADLVRAAQPGRAGPRRRKWFTPESSPCRKRTKS